MVLITKVDLAPHLDFDVEALQANIRQVNPHIRQIPFSVRTGQGMEDWLRWLQELVAREGGA